MLSVEELIFLLVWFTASSFQSFVLLFGSLMALISHMHAVNINFLSYSNKKRVKTERENPVFLCGLHGTT